MAYEIDYYCFDQNISDDLVIFIPKLEYMKDYVITVPNYISKDAVSLYFICGIFDTDIMYKNKSTQDIMMDYRDNQGFIKQISIKDFIIIDLLKGGQFIFYLKDSASHIVSEKGG